MFLPKLNAEAKVCAKCKNNSAKPTEPKTVEAPDAYYRRLDAMGEKQANQEILDRLQKLKENKTTSNPLSKDEEIKNRLQNIKGETPTTSDAEIYARLAKLRGVPVEVVNAKPVLPPPDTRTEQEQADDLIKQYMEQTGIDTKYQNEFDGIINSIESRVQKLKGSEPAPARVAQSKPEEKSDESEDEETTVKKIIEKIKKEATIEDEIPPCDELPFCEICNEDARMRCLGCRYLFCKRCFLDHKDDDDGCDRYEPYEAPKNKNY